MTDEQDWRKTFREVYDRGIARYREGARGAAGFFSPEDSEFLRGIGCTDQEMFDFVEDFCTDGEPTFESVIEVQAERRDFLLNELGNQLSDTVQSADSFPPKSAELGGISWLPRITAKVRAKLRGQLPPELMYG